MKDWQGGFTLIETLVALAVFAIVSLAVTSLMVKDTQMISENAQSSRAIAFAQEALETLREVPVVSLMSGSWPSITSGGTTFNVSWTATNNSPAMGMTAIVVTVNWQHKGSPRTYALQSIFTNLSQ
jgi:prepilin-type N-terminal cleavage/methylation domain-containing protein